MQLEVNNALSFEVPLCEGDITSISVDAIVNGANETLFDPEGIDRDIHEAVGPRLLD